MPWTLLTFTYGPSFPSGFWTTQTCLSPWVGEAISVNTLAPRFAEFLPGIQESILSIEVSAFDTKLFAKLVDVERNNGHRELTFESPRRLSRARLPIDSN